MGANGEAKAYNGAFRESVPLIMQLAKQGKSTSEIAAEVNKAHRFPMSEYGYQYELSDSMVRYILRHSLPKARPKSPKAKPAPSSTATIRISRTHVWTPEMQEAEFVTDFSFTLKPVKRD